MTDVFVSARVAPKWLEVLRERLNVVGHYNWAEEGGRFLPAGELIERLQGCQVLFTESDEITEHILAESPSLCLIAVCRGTVINVDLEAATRHGVAVLNTPARNAFAVADLTVALMVMTARNLIAGADALRAGKWYEGGKRWAYLQFQGDELPGKTVGLVGLGAIGRLVARRLSGFDMTLLGYDPYVSTVEAAAFGVDKVELDDLMRRSDFVSLHAPLNDATRGMLGAHELALMKPSAYLINTARAALVDEEALLETLRERRIAGAGIDVFHREPVPADYPLLHMPHVVAIPHLGGASRDVIAHQSRIAVDSILSFTTGEPKNVVNPEATEAALKRLAELG